MRFRVTVRVSKTVILESDGKDAEDAMGKVNFSDIELDRADYQIVLVEQADD